MKRIYDENDQYIIIEENGKFGIEDKSGQFGGTSDNRKAFFAVGKEDPFRLEGEDLFSGNPETFSGDEHIKSHQNCTERKAVKQNGRRSDAPFIQRQSEQRISSECHPGNQRKKISFYIIAQSHHSSFVFIR